MASWATPAAKSVLLVTLISFLFSGRSDAGWVENGKPVCDSPGDQWYPLVIRGGGEDGIFIWQDYRDGNGNVFAQSMGGDGLARWTANGIPATGDPMSREFFRQAVPDGEGGAVIAWMDHRSGNIDIYLQRISSEGALLWGEEGLQVAGSSADEYYPALCASGGGGVIIAWQAGEEGSSGVRIQRISGEGTALWQASGVPAADAGIQSLPSLAPDGSGGAVVAWIDGEGDLAAQRLDRDGNRLWGASGVTVCEGCDASGSIRLLYGTTAGALAVWQDTREGDYDIYAQSIGPDGGVMFGAGGLPVSSGPGDQWLPQSVQYGAFAYVAWMDGRSGEYDVYAQLIDFTAGPLWIEGGVAVCSAAEQQLNPRLAVDDAGAAMIVWQDGRNGDYDIYAQKMSPAGAAQWDEGGMAISVLPGDQRLPELIVVSSGGAMIAWEDWREGADVACQKITSSGDFVATGLAGYSASVDGGRVELLWRMNVAGGEIGFIVSRKRGGEEAYCVIPDAAVEAAVDGYSFIDGDVLPGTVYLYMVEALYPEGRKFLFETGELVVPEAEAALYQNYPNPFNPLTTIEYYLPEGAAVSISVYDAAGRRVAIIENGYRERGRHSSAWNGMDESGGTAASGVYFCRFVSGKTVLTRKMVLLR